MELKSEKNDTKRRLILAACVEFADMGYSKARIREISHNANANLAAVNYHFGNKAKLYFAVMEYVFAETEACSMRAVDTVFSAEEGERILRESLQHYFCSIINKNKTQEYKAKLMYREILEPSEIFDELYERFLRPRIDFFAALLMGITGHRENDVAMKVLIFSLIPQFAFYSNSRVLHSRYGGEAGNFLMNHKDEIIDKIIRSIKI